MTDGFDTRQEKVKNSRFSQMSETGASEELVPVGRGGLEFDSGVEIDSQFKSIAKTEPVNLQSTVLSNPYLGTLLASLACYIYYSLLHFSTWIGGDYLTFETVSRLLAISFHTGLIGAFAGSLGFLLFRLILTFGLRMRFPIWIKERSAIFSLAATYLVVALISLLYNFISIVSTGLPLASEILTETCIKPAFTIYGSLAVVGGIFCFVQLKFSMSLGKYSLVQNEDNTRVFLSFLFTVFLGSTWYIVEDKILSLGENMLRILLFDAFFHVIPMAVFAAGITWILIHKTMLHRQNNSLSFDKGEAANTILGDVD